MSWRAMLARPGGVGCWKVHRLVQSYLDGELSARDRDRLAAHLDRCPACGVEAETYRRIKAALAPEVPPEAVGRLEAYAVALAEGRAEGS